MPFINQINVETGCVLIINKPLHWTSFDVVNKIRYSLQKNLSKFKTLAPGEKPKVKVGHAGTLDPLATGVLVVCVGKETKNIDAYMATEKEYTGSIILGATTPSFDLETEPTGSYSTQHITRELIHATLPQFIGQIKQIPPLHSAIKKDGKRLYEHARAGEAVLVEPRMVEIKQFEIEKIDMPTLNLRVVCSKGTYIRSLANDFGKALNSGGYLASLCRTKSGEFSLNNALTLEQALNLITT